MTLSNRLDPYSINTKSVDWRTSRFLHNYALYLYSFQHAENHAWIRPAVEKIFEVKPVYTFSIYTVDCDGPDVTFSYIYTCKIWWKPVSNFIWEASHMKIDQKDE